jgi:hypothetical protein
MFVLGESMCKAPPPPSPVSVATELPGELAGALGSPLGGRVQLARSKVADNYTMGKVCCALGV